MKWDVSFFDLFIYEITPQIGDLVSSVVNHFRGVGEAKVMKAAQRTKGPIANVMPTGDFGGTGSQQTQKEITLKCTMSVIKLRRIPFDIVTCLPEESPPPGGELER